LYPGLVSDSVWRLQKILVKCDFPFSVHIFYNDATFRLYIFLLKREKDKQDDIRKLVNEEEKHTGNTDNITNENINYDI
jgi:hypothetical protein